jgi:hypothetical protein
MNAERKIELAWELLECHDAIEDVGVSYGTVKPCIKHGQSTAPAKDDFPEDIEAAIDGVLGRYDSWRWDDHGDFRSIEHAGASRGAGSCPRRGPWWFPVIQHTGEW